MTKSPIHDELLRSAVDAHEQLRKAEESVKELRHERKMQFVRALHNTVTIKEIARETGLSASRISQISKG